MATVVGVVFCLAGVVSLVAAFVGAARRPQWNWRNGPARWLGTLGTALVLAGVLNLLLA